MSSQLVPELVVMQLAALFFLWSAPVAFRRVALETPAWTSRDSNHHRQSVSAGKTNAIPTEPSGRLMQLAAPVPEHTHSVDELPVVANRSTSS